MKREPPQVSEEGTGPGAAGPTVLEVRGVSKVYRTGELEVVALRDVDLTLHESELVVLLGASGSGKSTLMNILGGLDRPTWGRVLFRDTDLSGMRDWELSEFRRNHVGFAFQFYHLVPSLTVRENVGLVAELSRNPMRSEDALDLVGLGDCMDHFPVQLSGGERQRASIARAIVKQPAILLCDEPTGGLDYPSGVVVIDAIDRANRELGTTTAVITHHLPISEMADRVVTLADGRILEEHFNHTKRPGMTIRW